MAKITNPSRTDFFELTFSLLLTKTILRLLGGTAKCFHAEVSGDPSGG